MLAASFTKPANNMRWIVFSFVFLISTPVHAQTRDALLELINAYRATPAPCGGSTAAPMLALTPHPGLANVHIPTGYFLDQILARRAYPVAHAEVISVAGPADPGAVFAAIAGRYCRTLLSQEFTAIGISRSGNNWQILLARPAPPSPLVKLLDVAQVGRQILDAVNRARASTRVCGEKAFAPAPPLQWNNALGTAALVHSTDMATQRYFKHVGKDGRQVADRALAAGYRWRYVGENIAAGQETPDEAVAGWLISPGHCSNIMSPLFSDMGAAYAITHAGEAPRAYWTQVFGTPR